MTAQSSQLTAGTSEYCCCCYSCIVPGEVCERAGDSNGGDRNDFYITTFLQFYCSAAVCGAVVETIQHADTHAHTYTHTQKHTQT